jgi:hypothetical protein
VVKVIHTALSSQPSPQKRSSKSNHSGKSRFDPKTPAGGTFRSFSSTAVIGFIQFEEASEYTLAMHHDRSSSSRRSLHGVLLVAIQMGSEMMFPEPPSRASGCMSPERIDMMGARKNAGHSEVLVKPCWPNDQTDLMMNHAA